MSQCKTILKHLEDSSITSFSSFSRYGITRLAARIADLREQGYTIRTDMVQDGRKRYARYTLIGNGTG